jgi:hypothetical protein
MLLALEFVCEMIQLNDHSPTAHGARAATTSSSSAESVSTAASAPSGPFPSSVDTASTVLKALWKQLLVPALYEEVAGALLELQSDSSPLLALRAVLRLPVVWKFFERPRVPANHTDTERPLVLLKFVYEVLGISRRAVANSVRYLEGMVVGLDNAFDTEIAAVFALAASTKPTGTGATSSRSGPSGPSGWASISPFLSALFGVGLRAHTDAVERDGRTNVSSMSPSARLASRTVTHAQPPLVEATSGPSASSAASASLLGSTATTVTETSASPHPIEFMAVRWVWRKWRVAAEWGLALQEQILGWQTILRESQLWQHIWDLFLIPDLLAALLELINTVMLLPTGVDTHALGLAGHTGLQVALAKPTLSQLLLSSPWIGLFVTRVLLDPHLVAVLQRVERDPSQSGAWSNIPWTAVAAFFLDVTAPTTGFVWSAELFRDAVDGALMQQWGVVFHLLGLIRAASALPGSVSAVSFLSGSPLPPTSVPAAASAVSGDVPSVRVTRRLIASIAPSSSTVLPSAIAGVAWSLDEWSHTYGCRRREWLTTAHVPRHSPTVLSTGTLAYLLQTQESFRDRLQLAMVDVCGDVAFQTFVRTALTILMTWPSISAQNPAHADSNTIPYVVVPMHCSVYSTFLLRVDCFCCFFWSIFPFPDIFAD